MPKLSLVSEEVDILIGKEYTIQLNITLSTESANMTFSEKGGQEKSLKVNLNNFGEARPVFYPFAQQPHTVVSLGGTANSKGAYVQGHFTGCITRFYIDGIDIPLRGLMTSKAQNFTTVPGSYPLCHPCNLALTCPNNSTCQRAGTISSAQYTCNCNAGHMNVSGSCLLSPSTSSVQSPLTSTVPSREPVTDGVEDPTAETLKLYYIIAIAGIAVLLVSLSVILLAVTFRCVYARGKKKMQRPQLVTQITYHQGNGECCHDSNKDLNDTRDGTVPARRTNDYVKTHLMKTTRTSFDESDSVLDSINSPCSYRKSTSQETGFHTASEGPSTRSSPHRRSESKDSERYDSDFTSFETDSEDLTSGIEEVLSPNEVRLVSSGSMMGVPSSFRIQNPLSPHEKNILTPIKPNSSLLLSEDETDTEVSTNANNNRRRYYENDSLVSDNNVPKWYKTGSPSTVVESEGESPYSSKGAALHKGSRHKHRPPSLPHIKNYKSSSPHNSPYTLSHAYPGSHHMSNSPLVKSHRLGFDYPPTVQMIPPTYGYPPPPPLPPDPLDQSRLPAIAETLQYPSMHHHSPYSPHPHMYHPRQHDHAQLQDIHPAPYYPGYQGTSLSPGGGGGATTYYDLNSFSKVNPITYWEQQQRLRPTVDQDDPLRFLKEPCQKFEDVSTTPSVAESTVLDNGEKDSIISAPCTGRRPSAARGVYTDNVILPRTLPPHPLLEGANELDSEGEEEREDITPSPTDIDDDVEITHFPSADCTPTLLTPTSDKPLHSASTLDDRSSQNAFYQFPLQHHPEV